ncbi:hypothetical protein [Stenotrophomonas sp. MMGLT7]|uniref:hypothetical protein n=1 Tax=Stenotrophomonas sp. MMGLT7 TaxID=2901227 RepID=UPI001E3B1C66|nr:hypothetical protein [Stenotrophomonas sp. MMGLT7]MCD7099236.1 hypothetical protein [Stenotrophomonas sp. MMGLT7]
MGLAEQLHEGRILFNDQRDFRGYRWKNTRPLQNLPLPAPDSRTRPTPRDRRAPGGPLCGRTLPDPYMPV